MTIFSVKDIKLLRTQTNLHPVSKHPQ